MNEQENPSLGLADLQLMANIIQVTTERGAIKAPEMAAVGSLYNKLTAFVQAAKAQAEAQEVLSAPKGEEING